MIPAAVISLAASAFINDRPIDWIEYSPSTLNEKKEQLQPVLVFYTAKWDPTAHMVEKHSIDTFWIRRMIRTKGVVALRADCTDRPDFAHEELPDSIQYGATAVIAIYSPSNSKRLFILGNFFTEKELYLALREACRK